MCEDVDEYARTHPLRFCREKCLEHGYVGEALKACIEQCVEEVKRC